MIENAIFDKEDDATLEDLIEYIREEYLDATNVVGVSLDDRVRVIMEHDEGIIPETLSCENLLWDIENAASVALHLESERMACELLEKLAELLDELDLKFDQVSNSDPFERFPPSTVSDQRGHQVYEYRNCDGIDADVWHLEGFLINLYLCLEVNEEE
ncbi:hypothetical protein [Acanthopleuribacter pedis]|uniref:Uncharacterized protein n=1 Tax=Acanthopleuribacter pedis TaxID=442870 RepID=A0A8J7U1L4_9BACT|nr:hypothetical protein [Acanthopleuribacter pedis]MBO1318318.1 hypothetical protein [Acanthopleuribacter pedis]